MKLWRSSRMKINKDSLKARANNISKESNISSNVVYNRFFYDAFLSRLAKSQYKDHYVLKGGLYLSSILGVNTRNTMDIDFFTRSIKMEKEQIVKTIQTICETDADDGINFKVIDATDIRQDDKYGGFQVRVLGKLENIRHEFAIDIATGDPVVPSERNYEYKCLVTAETLSLKVYSLESVIAEKLQTILFRSVANSRSKDYYDLYILRETQLNNVDLKALKEAFKQTCGYRNYSISKDDALLLIDEIRDNQQVQTRWKAYVKKVQYADGIDFVSVAADIKKWINDIY